MNKRQEYDLEPDPRGDDDEEPPPCEDEEYHGFGCICADCTVPDEDDPFVQAALDAERPR